MKMNRKAHSLLYVCTLKWEYEAGNKTIKNYNPATNKYQQSNKKMSAKKLRPQEREWARQLDVG